MPADTRPPLAAALLLLAAVASGEEKPKTAPDAAAPAPAAAETPGSQLSAFGRQIPAQRPNRGIWIPSFSEGKLSSVVEAEVVTRIDDQRLFAENMTIHLHNDEQKGPVQVDMSSATYHMASQMIRSNERSKVSRSDFDLEGDTLIFDPTTSQGRMSGNVRMTIHNARGFIKNPEKPAAPGKNADDSKKPAKSDETASPTGPQTAPNRP